MALRLSNFSKISQLVKNQVRRWARTVCLQTILSHWCQRDNRMLSKFYAGTFTKLWARSRESSKGLGNIHGNNHCSHPSTLRVFQKKEGLGTWGSWQRRNQSYGSCDLGQRSQSTNLQARKKRSKGVSMPTSLTNLLLVPPVHWTQVEAWGQKNTLVQS